MEKNSWVKTRKGNKKLLNEYIICFISSVEAKCFKGENVVPVLFNVVAFLARGKDVMAVKGVPSIQNSPC